MKAAGDKKGSLYLIPSALGEDATNVIPEYVKQRVQELDEFIVENEKTARRYLRSIGFKKNFDEVKLHPISKHTAPEETIHYLDNIEKGSSIGLLSEAGAPGVADPGAEIVNMAHHKGIKVVPMVGPSSILLALMASGMNGQSFAFHGYLPIEKKERVRALKNLEIQSLNNNQSQIFMEAPYRNNKLLEDIITACHPDTSLCIAVNITMSNEMIKTKSVGTWKKGQPDLHKKPAIFILYRQ